SGGGRAFARGRQLLQLVSLFSRQANDKLIFQGHDAPPRQLEKHLTNPINQLQWSTSYYKIVKTFIASGDSSMPGNYLPDNYRGGTSYAANYFVFGDETGQLGVPNADGGKAHIPATIPDGTSNTIALGERFAVCGGRSGYPHVWALDAGGQ